MLLRQCNTPAAWELCFLIGPNKLQFLANHEEKALGSGHASKEYRWWRFLAQLLIGQLTHHWSLIISLNQIQIYETFETDEKVYIVMEYGAQGDMLKYLNRFGAMEEEHAKKLFFQFAKAMEFCQSKNIAHRDLKPQNLLLDSKGNLKVTGCIQVLNSFTTIFPTFQQQQQRETQLVFKRVFHLNEFLKVV